MIEVVDLMQEPTCEGDLHVAAAERRSQYLLRPYDRRVAEVLELEYRSAFWTYERRMDRWWLTFGRMLLEPAVRLGVDLCNMEARFNDACAMLDARRRGRTSS
jgi:hypothetical protein